MAEIELFLQGEGLSQVTLVRVPDDSTVQAVIEVAREHGVGGADPTTLIVFVEGQEEPLAPHLPLEHAGIHKRSRVHVHRCHLIEVTVNYKRDLVEHRFSPATTVGAVKVWADKEFKLSGVDATDHALQICGTTNRPADNVHIGSLVTPGSCAVCFDFVPKQRVEG